MSARATLLFGICAVLAACSGGLSKEELRNPESCRDCHGEIVRQWSGSMHAYAADDPVFLALNQKGQRETNGALGDFCVKCHAPIALRPDRAMSAPKISAATTMVNASIRSQFRIWKV